MQKNVASQKVTLFAFDYSTGAPKTGDGANITAYVAIDDGSVTVLGDTSATEIESTNAKGLYSFDLTQAETNGNKLVFSAKSGTANVAIVPQIIQTVTVQTGDSFARLGAPAGASVSADVAAAKVDTAAIKTKTDFLPSATAGAASGVAIVGSNMGTATSVTGAVGSVTGAVGSVTGAVGSVTGNIGGNVTGSVGSVVGAVGSVTAGVTVTTNNDKTGYALTQAFPSNFASLGINASGHVLRTVLTDTLTTYTNNTPQTGDNFPRLGAPAGASIAEDISNISGGGGGGPTAPEIATEVWATAMETGVTFKQGLQRMAAVIAGKVSGAGTGVEVFVGLDGATTRVTVTVSDIGNRTTVVYA